MENRNQLCDVSIMDVMRDIESTEKTDYITDLKKSVSIRGTEAAGSTRNSGNSTSR